MIYQGYTNEEIIDMLTREYDREMSNRFTLHEDAITLVAARFVVAREKVKALIETRRSRDERILAAARPGEAAEELVPDTFPVEWVMPG